MIKYNTLRDLPNILWLDLSPGPQETIHVWYYKPGQNHVALKILCLGVGMLSLFNLA